LNLVKTQLLVLAKSQILLMSKVIITVRGILRKAMMVTTMM
jgi:hypothetical protein